MAEINYSLCIKKKYPTITDADFSFEQDENGLRLLWNNPIAFGTNPELSELEPYWLAIVKTQALLDVKDIRKCGLDKAALSPGILAIYDANYTASVNLLVGDPDVLVKNGMTSVDYLTGFGSRLGMSAVTFANYIIAENHKVGPTAYQVEARYLALTYGGDAANGIIPINYMTSVEQVQSAVANFITYCAG